MLTGTIDFCHFIPLSLTLTNPKHLSTGLHSDEYRPISFKLGMMIATMKFYILISVWMTLTLFRVTVALVEKSKTMVSIFLQIQLLI